MAEDRAVRYDLRLYVAGSTLRSNQAVRVLKRLCGEYLDGRCDLEVVDIYQRPDLAREDNVLAVPTVVRRAPRPVRRLIGDLTDRERVRRLLGIPSEQA